tara:strand:+ start:25687 stop:25911 length:225 start_codon:yes stop_codon:yes gene_type:complete
MKKAIFLALIMLTVFTANSQSDTLNVPFCETDCAGEAPKIIREIKQRALKKKIKNKECYTWQDIEIIIFGEIQE